MQKLNQKVRSIAGSNLFFGFTLIVFFISSAWIALSARYPMAFDENYHISIIKLYATRLNPFFMTQPPGPATYGALTHDPSYLYHYLMSFPYRWIDLWTNSLMTHVLVLRFMDIAMFVVGLVLFRLVLLKTKASRPLVNITMLFFVLTPTVPLLAGQVNYDDLLVPLTALALLLALQFVEKLKVERKVSFGLLVAAVAACCAASLVKFPFLPIFAAIVVYIGYELLVFKHHHPKMMVKSSRQAWHKLSRTKKIVLVVAALISIGLFFNTYGVNLIEYHNPVPQCGQVLGPARCATYPPWARNYIDALNNKGVDANPLRFTVSWFYGMFTRLFFTINSSGPPSSNANHLAPVMAVTAALVGVVGFALCLAYGPRLLRHDAALSFLLFVTLAYCAALWGRNYHDYLHLGQIVAINGRYLILLLPPVYLLVSMSYQQLLLRNVVAQGILLVVVLLLFLEGGGVTSFIYYSNSDWYWPHDHFAQKLNERAQSIVRPIFISRQ